MHERIAIVSENGEGAFGNTVQVAGLRIPADEPVDLGGLGAGPDPYEFVMAGLGACTSMTIRLYATRKGWPLDHVEVQVRHVERASSGAAKDVFSRVIRLDGDLSAEERARLLDIAERCPVSRTLTGGSVIQTTLDQDGVVGEASS